MKVSKEQFLALQISFLLLIFAITISFTLQFLNHNDIFNVKWQGYNKFFVFPILAIFIYFVALFLANATINPIEKNNEKLKSYNHNLAHEIKTPLAVIYSNLELLELYFDKESIFSSKKEIKNIQEIIDNLLFLSENSNLWETSKISLKSLLSKYENIAKITYKKDFVLNWNKILLERLLENLVNNALKYKKEKSNIFIKLDKSCLEISNEIENNIEKKDEEKLFDTFYKLDSSRNSSWYWLWLSIVKKITDLHKLNIAVNTEQSIFKIKLYL